MQSELRQIECQIRAYAEQFLRDHYGIQALKKLQEYKLQAIYAYDAGISEVTGNTVKIAAKRDVDIGGLTDATKLTIRHELGHILDETSPDFPDFRQEIEHERIAWTYAKLQTPVEHWCRNLAIRTHLDPLKMQTLGFPCPEQKISRELLERATGLEVERMGKDSLFVDVHLAERYAMANLLEDPTYYS